MSFISSLVRSRLFLAVFLPLCLILLAIIAFFVVLLGRPEQRNEIARANSRVLSALWDGQGDCTFSAWSYLMLLKNKPWGLPRVRAVDWINGEPGHCSKAYDWHQKHDLFNNDELDT